MQTSRRKQFETKLGAISEQLAVPLSIYASVERDQFRKPRLGMWVEFLKDQGLLGEEVDTESSVFVGDAAGRTKGSIQGILCKPDFSCCDRDFAENAGLTFKTPEEFFLGQRARPFRRVFQPRAFLQEMADVPLPRISRIEQAGVIVFVGTPGAGKSSFFWKVLQPLGFERVNQDTLKSRQNCLKAADQLLRAGKSVAIGDWFLPA